MTGRWIPCWNCDGDPIFPGNLICSVCDGACGWSIPDIWGPWCPLDQPIPDYTMVLYPPGHAPIFSMYPYLYR